MADNVIPSATWPVNNTDGREPSNSTAVAVNLEDAYVTICERSGFKLRKSDDLFTEWNGVKALQRFADQWRHPQDFVRSVRTETEGHTSISPRVDDQFYAAHTWDPATKTWSTGSGLTEPDPDDL